MLIYSEIGSNMLHSCLTGIWHNGLIGSAYEVNDSWFTLI